MASAVGLVMEEKPPELEAEDYYFDGLYLVFTAAYHLKRGTCCNSGCRHCPYRSGNESSTQADIPGRDSE